MTQKHVVALTTRVETSNRQAEKILLDVLDSITAVGHAEYMNALDFSDEWGDEPTIRESFRPEVTSLDEAPSHYPGHSLEEILAEIDQFQETRVIPRETLNVLRGVA